MSFQWVIDNAETISIDTKPIVATTTARDGTLRTVNRGGNIWRFTVKLPDGPRWSDVRTAVSKVENLDRIDSDYIQINKSSMNYISQYMGSNTNAGNNFYATWTKGADIISVVTSHTSGYKFRAGDYIQLKYSGGRVYKVKQDVAYNSNTVYLNRPVLDDTDSGYAFVGQDVRWIVRCVQIPTWTIFQRDQISWSGPFIFHEAIY